MRLTSPLGHVWYTSGTQAARASVLPPHLHTWKLRPRESFRIPEPTPVEYTGEDSAHSQATEGVHLTSISLESNMGHETFSVSDEPGFSTTRESYP